MPRCWAFVLFLIARQAEPFSFARLYRTTRLETRRSALFDDSIDVTPEAEGKSGLVLRTRVIRKGDQSKGRPRVGDRLYIGWKLFNSSGNLVHATPQPSLAWLTDTQTEQEGREEEPPFDFLMGAEPREVIRGWELAALSMLEGEIAEFKIDGQVAFTSAELEPLGVAPNSTVTTELELLRIIPSPERTYQTVGADESIKDELMEKIQRGDSPLSKDALKRSPSGTVRGGEADWSRPIRTPAPAPVPAPGTRTPVPGRADEVEEVTFIDVSASALLGSNKPTAKSPLPPGQKQGGSNRKEEEEEDKEQPSSWPPPSSFYISGDGRGHSWVEDARTIDVYIALPRPVTKAQLDVKVERRRIAVSLLGDAGERLTLLEGPLHGAVRSASISWAILPPDPAATFKGDRLLVSLEKAHESSSIWASVLLKGGL